MAHQWLATVLGVTSLLPNAQAILFNYPYDNGIRVIGFEDIMYTDRVYYGDEIDLKFWSLLKLPFGQSNEPENPLTLQTDYLYKYNHKTRIFDVYDENGIRIIHKTNIQNIAQMNIDFTIANSHQFWIITGSTTDGHIFMFPAILKKSIKPADIELCLNGGVNNIYLPDRVRPYLPDDLDNPTWDIKYLALYDEMQRWVRYGHLEPMRKYQESLYTGLHDYEAIDWSKNCPVNYFYIKGLYEKEVKNLPEDISKVPVFDPTKCYNEGDYVRGNTELTSYTLYKIMSSSCQTIVDGVCSVDPYSFTYIIKNTKNIFDIVVGKRYFVNDIIQMEVGGKHIYYLVKAQFVLTDWEVDIVNTEKICTLLLEVKRFKRFTFFTEKINLLYMQLGIGLYPAMMPVQRYGETQNNRPIYEPWLIWGFYKFMYNKFTNDDDESITIPLFDLSPMFS